MMMIKKMMMSEICLKVKTKYWGKEKEDTMISGGILKTGKWEEEISIVLKFILENNANKDAIVLDIGANLGIHGLYAAKLGHRVWAIEPQQRNIIKVC